MKLPKIKFSISIIALLFCLCLAVSANVIYFKKFTFDENKALKKWGKMILNGEVDYALVQSGDEGYVKAVSEKTCSALYRRVGFNLKKYPILKWKWRVMQFPDISKAESDEERDDYAARIHVIFLFFNFSSTQFLEYAWAENTPPDTILTSPFGDNIKIIVVRSGREVEQEWVSESRNVYEDYIRAFGKEPKKNVGAIAIMCDADGTKTSAEALFDNITIEGKEGL